jgi:hypothetical protein
MKSWGVARWLANKISMISTEPADWLENTERVIERVFYLAGPHIRIFGGGY